MKNNGAAARKQPMNKTQVVDALAGATGLSRLQVSGLLDALASLAKKNLDQGPDEFTIPGLLRLEVVRKPATEEHRGIHPVTKKETVFKAKPARNVVKMVPSKGLKDVVRHRWE
jgi:nucleoid DNA-binding protein